jgi:ribonucrease Y
MGIFDTVSQLLSGKRTQHVFVKSKPKKSVKPQAVIQPQIDRTVFEEMLKAAQTEAKTIIIEAKSEAIQIKNETNDEIRRKEEWIDRKISNVEDREKQVIQSKDQVEKRIEELEKIKLEQLAKLERAANLTREEAKQLILKAVEGRLAEEMAKRIRETEDTAREEADKKAKVILVDAMKHGATDYVAEYTVSAVKLPDEEMKGRIIGKEGRNIRTFEQVTGVDVDLDEEGVIKLSCFDPVRREVARVSLERLMKDGRIQPGRIEELVDQVRKDIERIMFEEGEKLCHAVSVFNLPRPLISMLGRFKYRFSYGQNMIAHTLEETKIGVALAHEVGADVNVVRLGCLLHDIGKVITDEEGTHIQLGVDLLKKHMLPQTVVDCVAEHHEDVPFSSIESTLVYIADAISGSRPGARYEDIEAYIKRLTDLEQFAKSHEGVTEAFAFQAGRELRVIVEPNQINDSQAIVIAHEIKDEIEKKLTYPGQIRVTVIREMRAVDIAK